MGLWTDARRKQQLDHHDNPSKKQQQILVFVNPIGGSGKGRKLAQGLESICHATNISPTIQFTRYQGHASELARRLARDTSTTYDKIVCVGGDGLLHEIINGLLDVDTISTPCAPLKDDSHPPNHVNLSNHHHHTTRVVHPFHTSSSSAIEIPIRLSIIPSGTGNGVAMSLGVSELVSAYQAASSSVSIAAAAEDPPSSAVSVDLLDIHIGAAFQRYAILSLSWGMVADIDGYSETKGRWMGSARMLAVPLYMIVRNKAYAGTLEFTLPRGTTLPTNLSVTLTSVQRPVAFNTTTDDDTDEEEDAAETETETWYVIESEFSLVTVMNLPWLASDTFMAPECALSDGSMTLVFMTKSSRLSLLRMFVQASSGSHTDHQDMNIVRCSQVRILPKDLSSSSFVADGEILAQGPVHIRSCPEAASFATSSSSA